MSSDSESDQDDPADQEESDEESLTADEFETADSDADSKDRKRAKHGHEAAPKIKGTNHGIDKGDHDGDRKTSNHEAKGKGKKPDIEVKDDGGNKRSNCEDKHECKKKPNSEANGESTKESRKTTSPKRGSCSVGGSSSSGRSKDQVALDRVMVQISELQKEMNLVSIKNSGVYSSAGQKVYMVHMD